MNIKKRLTIIVRLYVDLFLKQYEVKKEINLLYLPTPIKEPLFQKVRRGLIRLILASIKDYEKVYGRLGMEYMGLKKIYKLLFEIDPIKIININSRRSEVKIRIKKPAEIYKALDQKPLSTEDEEIVRNLLSSIDTIY